MNKQKRERIISILSESFKDNKSTNFVLKQDKKTPKRLRKLIEYSIFYGENFGQVILSDDQNACTIILDTQKKKSTFKSILWDLKLVFRCIGLNRITKVLKRESLIKSHHPKDSFIHLWYIGVDPDHQGEGKGSQQLEEVIDMANKANKRIYLETSTERNFSFYEKHGFKHVTTITQLGYSLRMYCWQ